MPKEIECKDENRSHPAHEWKPACIRCGVFKGSDLQVTKVPESTMGAQFSVFNGHVNNADERARELMKAHAPKLLERVLEIEKKQGGTIGRLRPAAG